ncbi:hypothetical protein LOTGIDRAFT_232589 [Lottia gigantea]|uniref:Uncharacterized protein n=1 Tax=Lottia gigantea TaxID=225164 RepID=V4A9T3_LOTGI|nr:hypothetical protein LOTGIDRAFT_232589 [Lottia gigantea]ESO93507.1 hypothetical protein LOTGIDRAFT_232589 [Lottia gigantea]
MGCGSSAPVIGEATVTDDGTQTDRKTEKELGVKKSSKNKVIPLDSNSNREDLNSSNPVPKSVAFEVPLGPDKDKAALFLAKPPPRLKRLEPLALPKLTPEMLAEKQKLADEKRLQQLKKKASSSSKSSRRRKELMKAKQFEREQTSEIIHLKDEQMKSAEEKRVARLREIQEKQKLREERAKRAREKAKRLKEAGEDLEIDVEKDEEYNNSDADSWPGDENKIERKDQRAESGYSSPHKQQRNPREHPMSASTVDSFDTAFTRQPSKALQIAQDTDNFFDS